MLISLPESKLYLNILSILPKTNALLDSKNKKLHALPSKGIDLEAHQLIHLNGVQPGLTNLTLLDVAVIICKVETSSLKSYPVSFFTATLLVCI